MPSLESEDITGDAPPTSIDPYAVLSVDRSATEAQIKTAYRRAALAHHPDKATDGDKESATQRFQEVAFAYAVLSDPRRRARYDATGRTEESLHLGGADGDDDDEFDWRAFYASQFADVVSAETIAVFKKEYQGSEEEREHVLAAYEAGRGDMDAVFEAVMLSEIEADEERFRGIISKAIADGEVQGFKKFTGESDRSKKARRERARGEAKEAEELAVELGVADKLFGNKGGSKKGKGEDGGKDGGEDGLRALIMQRQKGRADNFLADLEAKYAPKPKGKKGAKAKVEEPPEELFAQNRKRGKENKDDGKEGRKSKRAKA